MSDNTGSSVSSRSFDSFGRVAVNSETVIPDFGYAGYYVHARSGLNLTVYRAYTPQLAKWLSRDPLEEVVGSNLLVYVNNDPINKIDQLGLVSSRNYPPNRAGSKPKVCFPACDTGDLACCSDNRNSCKSQCWQYYVNKPGAGNDFLTQCLNCCDEVFLACMTLDLPDFSPDFWKNCFQNPVNRSQTTQNPPRRGAAAAGGGGWWPRGSKAPPPRRP